MSMFSRLLHNKVVRTVLTSQLPGAALIFKGQDALNQFHEQKAAGADTPSALQVAAQVAAQSGITLQTLLEMLAHSSPEIGHTSVADAAALVGTKGEFDG
jgi:hypothetical protein